jgi:hypothetical protein
MPLLLVLVTCAVAPLPAPAQNGLGGFVDSVGKLDRNFEAADKNADGLLSRDEAKAGHVPFIVRNFDAIDTAKRGSVSKDDVHAFIQRSLMRGQPRPAAGSST